jgi:hypothetical protein
LFVSCQSDKRARAEAILGEIAELGLMLSRDLAVRARQSEDPDETVALTQAFHKTARTVRLTLALDFKLERDAARSAREEAREAQADAEAAEKAGRLAAHTPAPPSATERRQDRVRNLVNRLIWNECEGDSEEYEVLFDDLGARLDEAARSDDFATLPIETLARRIAADMGLSGEVTLTLCEPAPRAAGMPPPAQADSG